MGKAEEGWQKVQRKGAIRKTMYQRPSRKLTSYPNTTFFVSNLPQGCTAENLRSTFKEFGEILDAYVAVKKDKMGGVFGFIRFPPMDDAMSLEVKLNMVRSAGSIYSRSAIAIDGKHQLAIKSVQLGAD
ncbi:hypothetical protein E3N88_00862 [Mikania micrantha]|uniref:RRM domain-containing protein n=1 Tax=Mikania micrantha TaxID=192012 RepID=A0A5N6Q106_9ASTR|nr:hypothetical protein E3N88_00862 [Mikania micrantha]